MVCGMHDNETSDNPAATASSAPTGTNESVTSGESDRSENDTTAPRELRLRGIHHLTAICSNLERTVSFYRDLLGLSLIKRTHNDDDPGARHFYFGDPEGTPGTMVTFLEYPSMDQGQIGVGVVHHFALRAGTLEELEAWYRHLRDHGIQCTQPLDRTYFSSIYFRDPDGNIIEIATDGPGLVID
jgi:catechol 2,3-dioxygenase-like lactoylglutathione lyase family enzyme